MFRLRLVFVMVMIFALAVAGMPTAAQEGGEGPTRVGLRPDAPTYALHGPYWVGTREFVIEPDSERPLPVTVWYPVLNPDGVVEEISYVYDNFVSIEGFTQPGHAIQDAIPNSADGPYPMVIVSHGSTEYRYVHAYLTEHLASYGFVVMAIDHTGNTTAYADDPALAGADFSGWVESVVTTAVYRPLDVQREIDFAAELTGEDQALVGMIDLEEVAVVGHSFGGYTALTSAGAQVHMAPLRQWCDANAANPVYRDHLGYMMECEMLAAAEGQLLTMRGLTLEPGELWPPFEVHGVDAIVPISSAPLFAPDSFEYVTVPTLVMVGTNDYFPHIYDDAVMTYEALPGAHKGLVAFENAGHTFAIDSCNEWRISRGGYQWCSDSVWDMDRAHDLINHFTTAFLLDVLKGDAEAHAALLPDAVSFPGITYETTMR